jgi:ATP-dependent Clp endopeptidase proteolytic subunit ClpP
MIKYQIDPKIKFKKIEELVDLPYVVVVNEFDEKSAKAFRDDFARALNTGQKIVPVVIDSYGGQCYSLLSMAATIKQSPVPVATIATGKAMSCGAILFTCGAEGHRYIDPLATLLIHDVSGHSFGKVEDVKTNAEEIERLNQMVYIMMARNIGKADDYFLKMTHDKGHADLYFSAEQCKEHNIANHIRTPSFRVKVSTETVFE